MAFGSVYKTGTASVASGDTTVTLTGGLTVTLEPGDTFNCAGASGIIDDITDDTHFELVLPWSGATQAGAPYVVQYLSPTRYESAYTGKKLRELLTLLDGIGIIYYVPEGQTEPDVSVGEDGQFAIRIVPGAAWTFWVKDAGVWVSLGAPLGVAWKALWSSATAYLANDIVSRAGVLYIALLPGTNHPPESSPTYWQVLLQGGNRYDLAFDASDRPDSGDTFRRFVFTATVQFLAGMSESRAVALIGATSTAVFSLQRGGTEFGTITFAPVGAAAAISIATPGVVTDNGHGLTAGAPILFTTTGRLPTGLLPGTIYYVVNPTTNTYQLALAPGGPAIATSGSQSGAHTRFSSSTGVIACPATTTFVPGDILTMVAPNPRDATLANIAITLTGFR